MTLPFGALRFLYVGTASFDEDLAFYTAHVRLLPIPAATRSRCLRISGRALWKAPTPIPPIVTLFEIKLKD